MHVDQLATFLAIVQKGSFSEAARHLGLSQPAVTFQVQRLERELGVRLLNRGEGRVTLTAAGQAFLDFAEATVRSEERLRRRLQQLEESVAGSLLLGGSTVPGEYVLPRLLGEFCGRHPGVVPEVRIGSTADVIEWVQRGTVQVGFAGAAPEDGRLRAVAFAEDELILVVPPDHAWARVRSLALEDLAGERILVREAGSGSLRRALELLSQAGVLLSPRGEPSFGSTQALLTAVQAGFGAAFVSRSAARAILQTGALKEVPLAGPRLMRDLYCVWNEDRVDTRLLAEFVRFATSWRGPDQAA